jgi:hypothetical protein
MSESEQKWIETNKDACAVLRQLHDMLALSSLPPRRTWVGLTYEEQEEIVLSAHSIRDAINKTDQKLKEKNA